MEIDVEGAEAGGGSGVGGGEGERAERSAREKPGGKGRSRTDDMVKE